MGIHGNIQSTVDVDIMLLRVVGAEINVHHAVLAGPGSQDK